MMHPKAPHREWTPPAKWTNLFANVDLPLPATFNDDHAGRSRAAAEATMRMSHLTKTDLKAPLPEGLTAQQEKEWRYQRYIKDHYPADHRVQPHYGVRTERHKLIYFNNLDEWELFDLAGDPGEMKNVYSDPAYATTVADLKKELARLRKDLDDRDQFTGQLGDGEAMQPVPLELVFRSDAAQPEGTETVAGRKGRALKFAGEKGGTVAGTAALNPAHKPFTVGAWCKPGTAR